MVLCITSILHHAAILCQVVFRISCVSSQYSSLLSHVSNDVEEVQFTESIPISWPIYMSNELLLKGPFWQGDMKSSEPTKYTYALWQMDSIILLVLISTNQPTLLFCSKKSAILRFLLSNWRTRCPWQVPNVTECKFLSNRASKIDHKEIYPWRSVFVTSFHCW